MWESTGGLLSCSCSEVHSEHFCALQLNRRAHTHVSPLHEKVWWAEGFVCHVRSRTKKIYGTKTEKPPAQFGSSSLMTNTPNICEPIGGTGGGVNFALLRSFSPRLRCLTLTFCTPSLLRSNRTSEVHNFVFKQQFLFLRPCFYVLSMTQQGSSQVACDSK